jgi:hypothetical protein
MKFAPDPLPLEFHLPDGRRPAAAAQARHAGVQLALGTLQFEKMPEQIVLHGQQFGASRAAAIEEFAAQKHTIRSGPNTAKADCRVSQGWLGQKRFGDVRGVSQRCLGSLTHPHNVAV